MFVCLARGTPLTVITMAGEYFVLQSWSYAFQPTGFGVPVSNQGAPFSSHALRSSRQAR